MRQDKIRLAFAAAALLVFLIVPAAFALSDAPPSIFLGVEPPSQNISAGGSATFTVTVYPQGKWVIGQVSLNLTNPPQGVTATFIPERMDGITEDGFASNMTVKAAADAPQGKVTLTVAAKGRETQSGVNLNASIEVELNIISPTQKTTTNTTATRTLTNTTTTTTITTNTTTTTTSPRNTTALVNSTTLLTTITITTTRLNTVTSLATSRTTATTELVNPPRIPDPTIPIVAFIIVGVLLAIAFLALRGKIG